MSRQPAAGWPGPDSAAKRGRPWLLSLLVVLIILASAVATLAVWVVSDLAAPDNFVAVVAPVAREPEVQAAIGSEVQAIVEQQIAAATSTSGNQGLAATLLRRQVERAIQEVLASDRFAELWDAAVLEVQAILRGMIDSDQTAVTITSGQVTINLAPFVAEIRAVLAAQGVEIPAGRLPPDGDYRVVVVESDQLREAQAALSLTNLLAIALPIVALVLLIVACFVARNWQQAVTWTGVGIMTAMALLLLASVVVLNWFKESTGDDATGVISDAVAGAIVTSLRTDLAIVAGAGFVAIVIGVIANRRHRGQTSLRLTA